MAAANQTSALQQALANQQAAAVAQMGGEGGGTENETLNALRQQIAANQINALQKQMQQQRNNGEC